MLLWQLPPPIPTQEMMHRWTSQPRQDNAANGGNQLDNRSPLDHQDNMWLLKDAAAEDAPIDANVFNSYGLPMGSFRTDDWKCITEGKGFE